MELDEFVAEVLKQIVAGVKKAQDDVAGCGAKVNPSMPSSTGHSGPWDSDTGTGVQLVDFDVALTTSEGTRTKGGVGILIAGIGLGSQGQSESGISSVSRIRFSVPLLLPISRGG